MAHAFFYEKNRFFIRFVQLICPSLRDAATAKATMDKESQPSKGGLSLGRGMRGRKQVGGPFWQESWKDSSLWIILANLGWRGEEGRYPAVYVPIPKVASLPPPGWLTSIDCFSRPQRSRGSPSWGRGCVTTTWQVPAFQGGGSSMLQLAEPPSPSLASPPKSPVSPRCWVGWVRKQAWRRGGCNVNRRRFSGHAILWRNLVNSI